MRRPSLGTGFRGEAMKTTNAWFAILACAACGAQREVGSIRAVALVTGAAITRVSVTVSPAGVTTDLSRDPSDATGNTFSGVFTVPAGSQTVQATAFAGTDQAGTGSAAVTVIKGQQAQVLITVLDTRVAPPVPDHSPVVTSLVVPSSAAQQGDQLSLSATAVDVDGDTIGFAWSVSPPGCGTFSTTSGTLPATSATLPATSATSTIWTAQAIGTCAITFTVTANGKSDSKSASVVVSAATGTVDVIVTYVPQPVITSISFLSGATTIDTISRTGIDATSRAAFHKGTAYTVRLFHDPAPDGALDLQDTCAGTIAQPVFVATATFSDATWTPTVDNGFCILTAQYTRQTLVDRVPVVVLPVP